MSRFGTLGRVVLAVAMGLAIAIAAAPDANAARGSGGGGASLFSGGAMHFGILGGVTNSSQEHINTLITRANSRSGVGPISTGALNSAYELAAQMGFRFSGSVIEMIIRPSFLYEKSSGSGLDGGYNYGVMGFTVFPMMRFYPLENEFMKFFLQIGLGYGRANASIEEGTAKIDAAGDAFGTVTGLGAEFCITSVQCITVEGNYRYLTMERNIASSASGTFAPGSVSQGTTNREVEFDGDDMAIRMGGIQALVGYIVHF